MTHDRATSSHRVATYRLQLTPSFGFAAATEVVPDLARLGVSHLYLSPVAEAVTGSTHGYDVVDPATVRGELGGWDGLRRLAGAARDHGLGLVLDLVPNHTATAEPERNRWWWALLRDGHGAEVEDHFDVDWAHGDNRVIVPALGRPLADAVLAGELVRNGDRVRYFERSYPLRTDGPAPHDQGGDLASDPFVAVLDAQHYRLQHWRDPDRNVRRFFTIDELVAVRPEVPAVAGAVAAIAEELVVEDLVDGVRVDHVDGLAAPGDYLQDLRRRIGDHRWLLVEKILVGAERFPAHWPAEGTTGYEWITLVDHVFTHPAGELPFTHLWHELVGDHRSYHEVERAGVREVLRGALRPDLERVARVAAGLLSTDGAAEPWAELVEPLVALTVHLGRYRTYLPTDVDTATGGVVTSGADAAVLTATAARARSELDDRHAALLDRLVEGILSGSELTRRWQQLTGPALAKGGEDRSLYRWLRLAAHNEVGGDPGRWSTPVEGLHEHNDRVAATIPHTLLAGSTHDTKRSEDTRARLLALAEVPDLWGAAVASWGAILDDGNVPVGAVGGVSLSLALQTVVAAWPIDARRLGDHLVKAAREADERTSWTDPDEEHEAALRALAAALSTGQLATQVRAFVDQLDPAAQAISLAQLTLRLTAPGVPDLYQGSEEWLHTLVDPDNRRELDADRLRTTVEVATSGADPWATPAPKATLIVRALGVRRDHPACFAAGAGYHPLRATGAFADHTIAFLRAPVGADAAEGSDGVITVVSRFPASRPDGWHDTSLELPPGAWHDSLTRARPTHSGTVELSDLLDDRPAAILAPTH